MPEAKFKINNQWFYRGNISPQWFFLAERLDGSASGIAETVPQKYHKILNTVSELVHQLSL